MQMQLEIPGKGRSALYEFATSDKLLKLSEYGILGVWGFF